MSKFACSFRVRTVAVGYVLFLRTQFFLLHPVHAESINEDSDIVGSPRKAGGVIANDIGFFLVSVHDGYP